MVNDGRLELGVGSLPPFGKRRVDIVITAKVSDSALQGTKLTADERQSYLLPELYVNSDSDQIIHLANSLRGDSEFESSRLVYEWVSQNVQALKYNIKPKAALNVIQERQGDCTDMMFLVVSLLRAQGIPARMLAGYIADRDSLKLDSSMYHNWAEFYDGSRWVISDPQRKKFDQGYSEYLVVKEVTSETVVGARFGIVGSDGINVNIL